MKRGVTLVELIITIVIVGVLSLGVGWYFSKSIDIWNFLSFRTEILNQARLGVVRMGREIRQVKKPTFEEETIEEATSTSFQFLEVTYEGDKRIRYRYDEAAKNLFREEDFNMDEDFQDTNESQLLLTGVENFQFTYLDREGNSTSVLGEIYRIKINLEVKRDEESVRIDYEVFPRNFKY
ncbi:MAG: type II secretion system protein [Candidatus Omnitrophica bacterium]|nr:type II secretion system protein [Candidatus Omnitrophota bacterium]